MTRGRKAFVLGWGLLRRPEEGRQVSSRPSERARVHGPCPTIRCAHLCLGVVVGWFDLTVVAVRNWARREEWSLEEPELERHTSSTLAEGFCLRSTRPLTQPQTTIRQISHCLHQLSQDNSHQLWT